MRIMEHYNSIVTSPVWSLLFHVAALVIGVYVIYEFVAVPEVRSLHNILLGLIVISLMVLIHRRTDVVQQRQRENCCGSARKW